MELEVRFACGGKYIEFTFLSGNAKMATGFLDKQEAQAFIKQLTELEEQINNMPEVKQCVKLNKMIH